MTELHWEGKYRDDKKVSPIRIALPFQTIETVNEARRRPDQSGDMFAQQAAQAARQTGYYNRLIWGDKKYVLPSLLPEFAGRVNLIYIDPPFDTGANFSFTANLPDAPDDEESESFSFIKQPSMIEQKAYRDTWGRGLDSYLQWFYETVVLLRELLAEDGSIYVHLDWRLVHYAKIVMDEVFGYENFVNHITWQGTQGDTSAKNKKYIKSHESILFYGKSKNRTWNEVFQEYSEGGLAAYKNQDEKGRFYWQDCSNPGGGGYVYDLGYGEKLPSGGYRMPKKTALKWIAEGLLKVEAGKVPRVKRYMNPQGVRCKDVWTDITATQGAEYIRYPTQKPVALLERIIKASSNEGDLVLDCFCGSGTTATVAEKLGRRWITCDLGRFAIHTARKRLLGIEGVKPFVVQNLGKYERQQWIQAEFEHPQGRIAQLRDYRKFICGLYHANILEGYTWLHGAKAGRLVHIGGVEAPITPEDIKAAILEFWKTGAKDANNNGIDFLGWEFAFDINETTQHMAAENKVHIRCLKIPREVLEKKAVEQGDIRFYELAYLEVNTQITGRQVELSLANFILSPDDLPKDLPEKITHWSQWIDYWAVDWDFGGRGDTFHNEWQSYRTKQTPQLELTATKVYDQAGTYTILVKVIDILGNDTTKVVNITV